MLSVSLELPLGTVCGETVSLLPAVIEYKVRVNNLEKTMNKE